MARVFGLVAALAALGVGGWFAYGWWQGDDAGPVYTTVEVERDRLVQAVTASGTLSPVITVEVGSQVSGRVSELFADYNDEVKKGQVIAKIDPQLFDSAVAQSRARQSSAHANLKRALAVVENARAQHERTVGLAGSGAVSQADVDTALAARRSAEAEVISARANLVEADASLKQAETNRTYTTISSPIDGIVVSRSVDVGQTVAASLSAPVLFVIAGDLRQMELHTSVAESDVGQLKQGMTVEFTVDAYPDETFRGTVKQVRYEAQTVSNVVTYDAVVEVPNVELKLRPGMTANASFVIAARDDVLVVPTKALRFKPKGAPSEKPPGAGSSGASGERTAGAGRRPRGDRADRGDATVRSEAPVEAAATGDKPAAVTPAVAGDKPVATGDKPVVATGDKPPAATGDAPAAGADKPRRRGRGKRPEAVWVLRDGVPVRIAVQTGLTDGSSTEVTSDELHEGDLVITGDGSTPEPTNGQRGGGGRGGGSPRGLF